jgi:hypothetical protein
MAWTRFRRHLRQLSTRKAANNARYYSNNGQIVAVPRLSAKCHSRHSLRRKKQRAFLPSPTNHVTARDAGSGCHSPHQQRPKPKIRERRGCHHGQRGGSFRQTVRGIRPKQTMSRGRCAAVTSISGTPVAMDAAFDTSERSPTWPARQSLNLHRSEMLTGGRTIASSG